MATKPAPTAKLEMGPLILIAGADIEFNPWNPNKMDGFMYSKAIESIEAFGMVDPVLVRELVSPIRGSVLRYQIIDGEHRARACIDLGKPIPSHSVGPIPDALAKRLTIALNEIHGQASPADMGTLLDSLLADSSIDDLLVGLPMTEDTIKAFTDAAAIQWPTGATASTPAPSSPADPSAGNERWVERTYRLPSSVADVLDQAIDRARVAFGDGNDHTDAECLEVIAAEFLAG